MVSSVRSGVYSVVEDLLATGDLPASAEARKVAEDHGMQAPVNRYDMARQLLDILRTKMPSSVSPYDSMLGLYISRAYLELYLATGNTADLDAAEAEAAVEADRYAQLVKYATTLAPEDLALIGSDESYGMQYLGEAVSIKKLRRHAAQGISRETRRSQGRGSIDIARKRPAPCLDTIYRRLRPRYSRI